MKKLLILLLTGALLTALNPFRRTVDLEVENMFCACDPAPDNYQVWKSNTPAGQRLVGREVRITYHRKDLFETDEFVTSFQDHTHYRVVGTVGWLSHTVEASSVKKI